MSLSLQEACKQARESIDAFEAEWAHQHQIDPEMYPLELPDNNAGVFFEQICEAILS